MCVHGIEEMRTWGNKNLGKHATLHASRKHTELKYIVVDHLICLMETHVVSFNTFIATYCLWKPQ